MLEKIEFFLFVIAFVLAVNLGCLLSVLLGIHPLIGGLAAMVLSIQIYRMTL